MARIPKNQILTNIQAQKNEFVYADSGIQFSGYYHIISGRAFAGGNESIYPVPIPLEKPQDNTLSNVITSVGLGTAAYNLARRNLNTANNLSSKSIDPHIIQISSRINLNSDNDLKTVIEFKEEVNHYFQKSNDPNRFIKKISLEDAVQLSRDPINKVVTINFASENLDEQLAAAEKIIPGITIFANL
jgi:hypothetical protein